MYIYIYIFNNMYIYIFNNMYIYIYYKIYYIIFTLQRVLCHLQVAQHHIRSEGDCDSVCLTLTSASVQRFLLHFLTDGSLPSTDV